jgi:hypothetical protein
VAPLYHGLSCDRRHTSQPQCGGPFTCSRWCSMGEPSAAPRRDEGAEKLLPGTLRVAHVPRPVAADTVVHGDRLMASDHAFLANTCISAASRTERRVGHTGSSARRRTRCLSPCVTLHDAIIGGGGGIFSRPLFRFRPARPTQRCTNPGRGFERQDVPTDDVRKAQADLVDVGAQRKIDAAHSAVRLIPSRPRSVFA